MSNPSNHLYEFGPFRIDGIRRILLRDGKPVSLTPKAFDTLLALIENNGRVLEKEELIKMLWPNTAVEERNLTVNISALRKALGESAIEHRYVVTIPGQGYRFVADVKRLQPQSEALVVEKHTRSRVIIKEEQPLAQPETEPRQSVSPASLRPHRLVTRKPGLKSHRAALAAAIILIGITVAALFGEKHRRAASAMSAARNEAQEAYREGRFFWNKRTNDDLFKSISYFEQAITKDTNYALGYAGLADAYVFDFYYWPQAEAMAKKALELDNTLAEPHATLGFIRMFWQWNWTDAEQEFKRAIELNPNYATAHQWYAIWLAAAMGRPTWGEAEMQKGLELDPSSLPINADMGQMFYFARHYDQAIAAGKRALDIDPDFINAHNYLYQAYIQKGMYAEAVEEFFKFHKLVGDNWFNDPTNEERLRRAYAADGIRGFWKSNVDLLMRQVTQQSSAYGLAEYYALLGEKKSALDWLERAYEWHNFDFVFVSVNPVFDDLRIEPRYRDLLLRRNLLPQEGVR